MTDVIEKLREAGRQTTPPHAFDFNAALHAGETRARRRRLAQVVTVVAVPVIGVALAIAWPGSGSTPSPAPPAGPNGSSQPSLPPVELVEPEEAFAIFSEPQDGDDQLAEGLPGTSGITVSTTRKLATHDGRDFYLAQLPNDDDNGREGPEDLACLVVVPHSDPKGTFVACTGMVRPLDPHEPWRWAVQASGGEHGRASLWADAAVEPLANYHAGWVFVSDNLAVEVAAGPNSPPRTEWGDWLDEAAQHYSVFVERQWLDDLLPPSDASPRILPWSSRLLGEYEGRRYWIGLSDDQETCLIVEGAGATENGMHCLAAKYGDDLNAPIGVGLEDTSIRSVPDDYEPTDAQKDAWTYIGQNLVVSEVPE